MVDISWDECMEFIRKLNQKTGKVFRLPTEAEWEFAARGGNKSRGYMYSGSNNINDVAWYKDNVDWNNPFHPVKTKQPNELGIYDMSGNVCERCQDWYGNYNNGTQTNPTGPSTGSYRVRRGGAWINDSTGIRITSRSISPNDGGVGVGFRLVMVK